MANKEKTITLNGKEYIEKDSINIVPKIISADEAPWEIGKHYMIRLVTVYDTGILVAVTPQELVLEDACWIPDTGRFSDALQKLEFNEVEPFPTGRVIIGRGAICDAVQIGVFKRSQK